MGMFSTKSLLCSGLALMTSWQVMAQTNSEVTQIPPQQVSDGGVEVVQEAQQMPAPPASKKFKDAKAVLNAQLKSKKWKNGWDRKKKRFIVVESAMFETADPASNSDFIVLRDAAIKRAILQAKAKIIEFCNTKMDAMDMVHTPGTNLNLALNKDLLAIESNLVAQKEELAALLAKYNKAEADALRGTTFADRLDDLMAATIKKLDKEYNANARDEKYAAKLAEAKRNFEVAQKRIAELEKKAKAMKGSVARSQSSAVKTFASMPLYGASAIMQTESWNGKNYQVAVAMVWSIALERSARAIVTGETYKLKPKTNGKTVEEWIESQNLATMVGPRQFVDKDGSRWFIGIAARPYDEAELNEIQLEENKDLAESFAKSVAAFSVWGDVESYKLARQEVRTLANGKDVVNNVAESMEKKLTQTIAGKTIRGLQEIATEEVEHPISGKTILVSVYAIDASSAKDALEIEKINYATKVMDERHQTVERGRDAANRDAVKNAKNRPEDFSKGYNQQSAKLMQEMQKREVRKKKSGVSIKQSVPAVQRKPAQSQTGTFGGDNNVDDDF